MAHIDMRTAWNQVAAHYQRRHAIPTDSAHYGPWAPLENELRLLGNVSGRRILEVGCGGGQCSIAFARQGATAAGIDPSDAQLDHARQLAAQEGVAVEFVRGAAEDLGYFADSAWDIVFSAYAFQYVADMPAALRECARVLQPQGRLVFSLDHPFRDCFFDFEENDVTLYPARSYFDHSPMTWTFSDTGVWMHSYHHTLAAWIDMLGEAGFRLVRLLEPAPPATALDEIWPYDDPLSSLRHIPPTVIFVAENAQ
ncbi:MAG: methyltransferase domain-containing protein [Caldilineaceae bacterium]|jgi:ubiquinone/menaquinone biosynthesis C-methylase UbiE|nr:methyltransferase domain-containing protein [Caldilineaceae bacterium]